MTWFSYVKHGDSRDSVILALNTPIPIEFLSAVTSVLNVAIADSIMVSDYRDNGNLAIDSLPRRYGGVGLSVILAGNGWEYRFS